MTSTTSPSETATIVQDDTFPVYRTASGEEAGAGLTNPTSHNPNNADLSFPFATTDIDRGGFTEEYRTTSKTGFVPADLALRPIPTHFSELPGALRDPEKARGLKDVKLVTWLPNDPEDPRNWSNAYRWCTYVSTLR